MCGRFVSASPPDEIAAYFGAEPPAVTLPDNFNVAPTSDVYAVTSDADHRRTVGAFHWGLVPMWAKDTKVGSRMINARAETAATKNSFRGPLARRRCLVPADGFFEWKVTGTNAAGKPTKQPMYIYRRDGEMLAMAGLWERWRGPTRDSDEMLYSTSVLTVAANTFMEPIHDRMPALLAPDDWDQWLDPDFDDVAALTRLLRPAPDQLLTAHRVDPMVGNVRNKGPELIAEITLGE